MTSPLLDAYATGRLPLPIARAVEERLAVDADLQHEAREQQPMSQHREQRNLDAILGVTCAPPRSRFERAAMRVGVGERVARVLGATPALRVAWCAAVFVVLVVAGSAGDKASHEPQRLAPYLALAPLVSLAGIALSYGRIGDRAHEVMASTPMSGFRLLMVRASAVLVAALSVSGLAALLAPSKGLVQLAWLLPTFAIVASTLALSTRIALHHAATVVGLAWLTIVVAAGIASRDAFTPYRTAGQVSCAALVVAATAVLVVRRRQLDRWTAA